MKKELILAATLLLSVNSFGQLVVDSLGRTRIGSTDTPTSVLCVGNTNTSNAGIACSHTGNYGMNISLVGADNGNPSYGMYINSVSSKHQNYGIRSIATLSGGNKPYAFGVMGQAGLSENSIGVYGGAQGLSGITNFAGIYGTTSTAGLVSFNYPGSYAGYFNGKVLATGTIYGSVSSLSNASNSSSSATTTLIETRDDESAVSRLAQMKNIKFSINDLDGKDTRSALEGDPIYSKVHHGLDAEQLEKLYPELVEKDNNGNYWINYIELIPILVKGINELSSELAELKGTSPRMAREMPTSIGEATTDVDVVRMDQNTPNPFNESTVIKLNIPQSTTTANILIYDLNGKQIDKVSVDERGETNVTVYASNLESGMYIYSLILDGKVTVTRKMIVEK